MTTATHHPRKKPAQTAKKAVNTSIPADLSDAWNQRMDSLGAQRQETPPHATLEDVNEWIDRVGAKRGNIQDLLDQ